VSENRGNNETKRKPAWLKVKAFTGTGYDSVNRLLKRHGLNTVCQAANCPNRGECFNRGTATFLILGPVCTRNCRFCNIQTGKPAPPDPDEPRRIAGAALEMQLKHVVITSVTRDDLPDGGAVQFAETVRLLRRCLPKATIELLTPDFSGSQKAWQTIMESSPDVFNHNVETVPLLYPLVRPGAEYQRSLRLLRWMHENSEVVTKSGLMVGMGESSEELKAVFADLARSRVSILTIGQYLAPSKQHFPVVRYLPPDEFVRLAEEAKRSGIPTVVSAPLVRSSYQADVVFSQRKFRQGR
jgi:lipoic acid synthetase